MILCQGQASALDIVYRIQRLEKAERLLKMELGTAKVGLAFVWSVFTAYISTTTVE